MSDPKRYGAMVHTANRTGTLGWTAETLAVGGSGSSMSTWPIHHAAQELARDLIAAQARIAQLDAHVAELQAEVDAQPVTITTRLKGDLREQLEVAQARIRELEAERDAAFDRGRGVGREDVGKYSNVIGRIESALGYAGGRPLFETAEAVASMASKLADAEKALEAVQAALVRGTYNDGYDDGYSAAQEQDEPRKCTHCPEPAEGPHKMSCALGGKGGARISVKGGE